ncbi:uncharacterized protein PGTG_22524 [Puccinia graminis f. sp. tritici CRL 75-36-700-3]|uniref:Uncharacterized protein n=1 Tax=Puccinia graminis f. sp. tritici (strain CRL 75-36-700-3 / race SCCL) TaxID=418459 RepID=H6QUT7_PUCGT|nr:uncharacterized protein PGTG_22524 [Puccinia graminis f. sp. tritici CRL 75-36-700-3]EHS64845.1 hypothetical protein PGTG_22524 [Puccinia graminis f. sp. tritici CRL 75-36-700-3]
MTPGSLEDASDASFHNNTLLDDQHDAGPTNKPRGNLDDRNVDTRRRHRDHTPLPTHHSLDNQCGINSMVNNAIQEFGSGNFLLADGSNFRAWTHNIEMIAPSFLQDKDFLNSPCTHPWLEPAGRRILLGVINSLLKHELYSKESSYKMMEAIKACFSSAIKA